MSYYGDLATATAYFDNRLHSESWSDSDAADRPKALSEATQIIDDLNYKGVKNTVWLVMYEYDSGSEKEEKILVDPPTRDEVIVADLTQELEFPASQALPLTYHQKMDELLLEKYLGPVKK